MRLRVSIGDHQPDIVPDHHYRFIDPELPSFRSHQPGWGATSGADSRGGASTRYSISWSARSRSDCGL
jgi:hypothetical protein